MFKRKYTHCEIFAQPFTELSHEYLHFQIVLLVREIPVFNENPVHRNLNSRDKLIVI